MADKIIVRDQIGILVDHLESIAASCRECTDNVIRLGYMEKANNQNTVIAKIAGSLSELDARTLLAMVPEVIDSVSMRIVESYYSRLTHDKLKELFHDGMEQALTMYSARQTNIFSEDLLKKIEITCSDFIEKAWEEGVAFRQETSRNRG